MTRLPIVNYPDAAYFESIESRLQEHLEGLNAALHADFIMISMLCDKLQYARITNILCENGEAQCFDYCLHDTPCGDVAKKDVCLILDGVQEKYPQDHLLEEMGIEAYIGVPILAHNTQKPVGIITALYKQEVTDLSHNHYLFNLFADVISLELRDAENQHRLQRKLNLLNEVGHISHTGGWEYDLAKHTITLTDEIYAIYGLPAQPIDNLQDVFWVLPESERHRLVKLIVEIKRSGAHFCDEFWFIDTHGDTKWVRISGRVEKGDDNRHRRLYGAVEDITLQRRLLQDEYEQRRFTEVVLDNLHDAVITYDETGRIKTFNSHALQIFGYLPSELSERYIETIIPELHQNKDIKHTSCFDDTPTQPEIANNQTLFGLRRDGSRFFIELNLSHVKIQSKNITIALVTDISEKVNVENTMHQLAYFDRVSKLPNKFWFKKALEKVLSNAASESEHVIVALVDIDKLGLINFKFGIEFGDKIILSLAERLKQLESIGYRVFKNGADSFYIFGECTSNLNTVHTQKKDQLHQSFTELTSQPYRINETELNVRASLSSIVFPKQGFSFEKVVSLLEKGLADIKKQPRRRTFYVSNDVRAEYERTEQIRDSLKQAVDNNEFALVLQPQYHNTCDFDSSEALLRWFSPQWGSVSPSEFIPIAEESSLILDIGDWVLNQACELLARLKAQDVSHSIAVNVSAKQFMQPDFVDKVRQCAQFWQIDPSLLRIELTESCLVSDINQVQTMMREISELGITFSIDDFGTGYSSLRYLKALPISELKIDKCFVDDIKQNVDVSNVSIVKTIVEMARALNVVTVAEGVEHPYQLSYLQTLGCNVFQGYLFSKPLALDEWFKRVLSQAQTDVA